MALDEIKVGNYQSLLGDWQEVAVSFNRHDGKGNILAIRSQGGKLDITADQIKMAQWQLPEIRWMMVTTAWTCLWWQGGYLTADTSDAAVIWNISFYPGGVDLTNWGDDVPTTVDSCYSLVIRSSSNNYIQVFQNSTSTTQATIDKEPVESKQSMALDEVKAGNYKSLNGTWQNGLGNQIAVKNETMQFTDITSNKEPGIITSQQLDIPGSDGPDVHLKKYHIGDSTMKAL